MTTPDISDPFETGRTEGHESGATQPLTEDQARHVRTMLRQADETAPPEPRRKAS